MLNFCTTFCKNASFGGYPNQDEFRDLIEKMHIEEFIDFTTLKERQNLVYNYEFDIPKFHGISYYNYCILDNKIPYCTHSFLKFIIEIGNRIREGKRIYIHCKGGHGRSTLFVACILMYLNSYSKETSLQYTKKFHRERKNLKEKYKHIDVPQSILQRNYVDEIHRHLNKTEKQYTNEKRNICLSS